MSLPAPRSLSALVLAAALGAVGCVHAPSRAPLAPSAAAPATPAAAPAPPAEAPASPAQAPTPAATAEPSPITFAAVGDIMLGNAYAYPDPSKALLPPEDGATLLAEFSPVLQAADVAFGNLEGPLSDEGTTRKCKWPPTGVCYAFRVPERYGAHLARAGFDVLSLANNHVGDFGDVARERTRAVLDRLGIRYAGAPGEVALLEVRGTRIAVAAFSVSAGTSDLRDVEGAARLVAELRARADLVVVSFHGGAEGAAYQRVPHGEEFFLSESRGDLRRFARAVVDAGAGLVLGHGPHVVRGLELYRGKLIAYSLGNFATYGGFNLNGPNGLTLVLEVQVAPDGTFLGGKIHPGKQLRPGGPRVDPAGEVIPVLRRLSAEDFGAAAPEIGPDGTIRVPAPGA
ncbi:MAG TPA: CapA family protein [Anaeromyxobacter sp.]|nr:CapA family protein [Anaeromyxobacter sp.]